MYTKNVVHVLKMADNLSGSKCVNTSQECDPLFKRGIIDPPTFLVNRFIEISLVTATSSENLFLLKKTIIIATLFSKTSVSMKGTVTSGKFSLDQLYILD